MMTITNYDEWAIGPSKDTPTAWWSYVNPDRGWWVEARLKLVAPTGAGGHGQGLEIHDGRRNVKLLLGPNDVELVTHTESHYAFDTHDFHVYRVQRPSAEVVQLLIDGKQVLDVATPELDLTRVWSITFGSMDTFLGGVWDYLSYDTAAPGTEMRDDDQDGIPLDHDLCPAIKDDGKDTDYDRLGDACDPCVNDPRNDEDGDGLCADKDICPHNAKNPDANANGLCDDDECAAGLPQGYELAAAGAEGAEVCQTAGLQCACYNRARANCSPKSTCASGCDCRFVGADAARPLPGDGGSEMMPTDAASAADRATTADAASAVDAASATTSPDAATDVATGAGGTGSDRMSSGTGATGGQSPPTSKPAGGCALLPQQRSCNPRALSLCLLGTLALVRLRSRRRGARPSSAATAPRP